MNTTALRKARQLFNNDMIPPEHNRAYQRKWVRSLRFLGDRWLLAKPLANTTQTTHGVTQETTFS
jgi:hypothetical protein